MDKIYRFRRPSHNQLEKLRKPAENHLRHLYAKELTKKIAMQVQIKFPLKDASNLIINVITDLQKY